MMRSFSMACPMMEEFLEISSPNISNGEFLDFTDPHLGGTCLAGCYTGQTCFDCSMPLAGRWVWSGNSGGYIDTIIDLGPNVAGQTITLRWRFGTDDPVAAPGWRIDDVWIFLGLLPVGREISISNLQGQEKGKASKACMNKHMASDYLTT